MFSLICSLHQVSLERLLVWLLGERPDHGDLDAVDGRAAVRAAHPIDGAVELAHYFYLGDDAEGAPEPTSGVRERQPRAGGAQPARLPSTRSL